MQKSRLVIAIAFAVAATSTIAAEYGNNGMQHNNGHWKNGSNAIFKHNPTVSTDRTTLNDDFLQLRSDRDAGNTAAVSTDQAKLKTDAAQLQTDITTLKGDITNNTTVQADRTALGNDKAKFWTDRLQFRSDVVAGNTDAVASDKTILVADRTQLQSDKERLKQEISSVVETPLR